MVTGMTWLFVFWREPAGINRAAGLPREQTHLGKHQTCSCWWWGLFSISCLWHILFHPTVPTEWCPPPPVWLESIGPDKRHFYDNKLLAYLYAWLPFLCVIRDVEQVPEALVGDKLVVSRDNACVSPGRRVSLLLFSFQPPLLFQDFLQGKVDHTTLSYAQHAHFFPKWVLNFAKIFIEIFSPLCPHDVDAALHPGSPHALGTSLEQKPKEIHQRFHREPSQKALLLYNVRWY